MKISKAQLKQIIKEELEVTLTNEEAGEMFGEEVEAQLNEVLDPAMIEAAQVILDAAAKVGVDLVVPVAALAAALAAGKGAVASLFGQDAEKSDELEVKSGPPAKIKEDTLAQAQQDNARAYADADPTERSVISKLETALLTKASDEKLKFYPKVVKAIELLSQALNKIK